MEALGNRYLPNNEIKQHILEISYDRKNRATIESQNKIDYQHKCEKELDSL